MKKNSKCPKTFVLDLTFNIFFDSISILCHSINDICLNDSGGMSGSIPRSWSQPLSQNYKSTLFDNINISNKFRSVIKSKFDHSTEIEEMKLRIFFDKQVLDCEDYIFLNRKLKVSIS
ncbi:MAG: hypothetical protein MHMPM18_002442 [Marteilia pararefringens]